MATTFKALRVFEENDGTFSRRIIERTVDSLPAGEVLVKVAFSGLNYKDALSATGHKGVTRRYPHTPGIDAAGTVVESRSPAFVPGQEVIVTSYDLGMNTDGGFGGYIRVPAAWVVPKPQSLSLKDSMVLGTAGFTAARALYKMQQVGQRPAMGPVVVTGASGGVGSIAVCLLLRARYTVVASTGKPAAHPFLKRIGAAEILNRDAVNDESGRALIRSRWAGAIDTVGGNTLATLIKACKSNGSIAACGLVGSPRFQATVYPFIINGINLLGVDSATCPMPLRLKVWDQLAGTWAAGGLEKMAVACRLKDLDPHISRILEGKVMGRVVVVHD